MTATPKKAPFIFSNLATSLDGKIATASREHFPLGTRADLDRMLDLRGECDAILMGAATIRAYQKPCLARGSSVSPSTISPANVIISRSLEGLDPSWAFFTSTKIKRVLFHTESVPTETLNALSPTSQIIQIQKEADGTPSAHSMIEELKKLGFKRLLVEGGGGLMWNFAKHDLIDEYNVTLTPRILGGKDAPSLVEGSGLSPDQVLNLKLKECKQVGDELFLVYTSAKRRGK